ncbi:hypothetical protein PM082_008211 [Marasmius tenuissimus]|nr:hypothetical protein PM082_008211 [Marasmius tenuissimus]
MIALELFTAVVVDSEVLKVLLDLFPPPSQSSEQLFPYVYCGPRGIYFTAPSCLCFTAFRGYARSIIFCSYLLLPISTGWVWLSI